MRHYLSPYASPVPNHPTQPCELTILISPGPLSIPRIIFRSSTRAPWIKIQHSGSGFPICKSTNTQARFPAIYPVYSDSTILY